MVQMPHGFLAIGQPAPWFVARSTVNPTFHFDSVGGRYVVLSFIGSVGLTTGRQMLDGFAAATDLFDDENVAFFAVSVDAEDERSGRASAAYPAFRFFWDTDAAISKQYGAARAVTKGVEFVPVTYVLDAQLRVLHVLPLDERPENHAAQIVEFVKRQRPIGSPVVANIQAPVLIQPRVFEPELCRELIQYYEDRGGKDSGFMRDVEGKTVGVYDYSHKRRRDEEIADEGLRKRCMHRIHDRLVPEIKKVFQFHASRMERYIVACYEANDGGHFRAHRDNTTKGTAHRRFAVSLILNTGEFEGGYLRFPEFGPHLYSAPAGGAVVFSCSLLHEATPVTKGKRFVFLPFLYDDAAAKIREDNLKFLSSPPGS